MKALRLLWRSRRVVLVIVGLYLVLAAWLSRGFGAAVAKSLAPFAPTSEGRVIATLMDLALSHSGHLGQLGAMLESAALLGVLLWTLLVGGVVVALDRPLAGPELLAAGLRHLPRIVVVSLWHLPMRAVLLALAGLPALLPGGTAQITAAVAMLAALGYSACALDLARVMVCLDGRRGFGPAVAWQAFLRAGRSPRLLLSSLSFSLLRWLLLVVTVGVAVAGFGQAWTPWVVRGLAAVAIACGLARLATAVAFDRRVPSGGPAMKPQQATAEAVAEPGQQQAG